MKNFALLLLPLLIVGCSVLGTHSDASPVPDQSASPALPTLAEASNNAEHPGASPTLEQPTFSAGTPTAPCEIHQAQLQLSSSARTLQVGDSLTLTATLTSSGCAMLGLPKYSLVLDTGGEENPFEPARPEPVLHSVGLRDGEQDEAYFTLQAITAGEAALQVNASFEVHLGYPGPAYWATATSQSIKVVVRE